jgi:hypothetical protein
MKTIPTWGYKAGEAQIFQLAEGESLPAGWEDSPAKVGAVKAAPVPESEPEAVEAAPEPEAEPSASPIPADWRELHHSTRIKLAKSVAGDLAELITNAKEADEFIEKYEAGNGADHS